jgi:hypothetical protein
MKRGRKIKCEVKIWQKDKKYWGGGHENLQSKCAGTRKKLRIMLSRLKGVFP